MGQVSNIFEGWGLYIKGKTPEYAIRRKEICKGCDYAVEGTYEKWMPEKRLKEIKGLLCLKCDCPLSTKLRSEKEKCPLNKW